MSYKCRHCGKEYEGPNGFRPCGCEDSPAPVVSNDRALSPGTETIRSSNPMGISAEDVRVAVQWLAHNAHGMDMQKWCEISATLLRAAETISNLRADAERHSCRDETYERQPIDCPHERASIKCPDCGIDFRNAKLSEPLLTAAEVVLTHFAPTFPDSRAWDDCLVGLAVAVSNFKARSPALKAGACNCNDGSAGECPMHP